MDRAKRTDRSVIDRIIARLISGAVAILHPTGSAVRIVVRGEIACDESYTSGGYFGTQVERRGRSSVLPLALTTRTRSAEECGLRESDGGRGGGGDVT